MKNIDEIMSKYLVNEAKVKVITTDEAENFMKALVGKKFYFTITERGSTDSTNDGSSKLKSFTIDYKNNFQFVDDAHNGLNPTQIDKCKLDTQHNVLIVTG
jgi:23S rRNA pseudoU1915 N3-methylase RlmH